MDLKSDIFGDLCVLLYINSVHLGSQLYLIKIMSTSVNIIL